MQYLYGRLHSVDSQYNRITVGTMILRTASTLSREIEQRNIVGKYVKVKYKVGTYYSATKIEEVEIDQN